MVECIFMDGKCMISWIKKHDVTPYLQILHLFLLEGFNKLHGRGYSSLHLFLKESVLEGVFNIFVFILILNIMLQNK